MNKFISTLDKNFKVIVICFLVILFFRSCGDNGSKSINKRIDNLTTESNNIAKELDSLSNTTVNYNDLRIEGLKVEKRLIQATDRKMLDVQRQNAIEKEIQRLEEK
tara:strand:+ start:1612 stop:1929 length:318 start_codon:yes stop_codon:yes gene_type:complete